MKYKVGDEVLVKARIIDDYNDGIYKITNIDNTHDGCKEVRHIFSLEKDMYPVKREPDMTAEEAWEIAGRILEMESHEIMESILEGDSMYPYRAVFHNLTPQEAKAKIEAWKAAKETIEVGDVIIPNEGKYREGECGLVVCITATDKVGVNHPGNDYTLYDRCHLRKTGRHIDIEGLLKQIGGDAGMWQISSGGQNCSIV